MKKKLIFTSLLAVLSVPVIALAYNGYCDGPGYGGGMAYHHMWGPGGFFGGGIFMIITILLTGVLVFFLVHYFKNNKTGNIDEALNIARNRFAKGEISKDEFDSIKSGL